MPYILHRSYTESQNTILQDYLTTSVFHNSLIMFWWRYDTITIILLRWTAQRATEMMQTYTHLYSDIQSYTSATV